MKKKGIEIKVENDKKKDGEGKKIKLKRLGMCMKMTNKRKETRGRKKRFELLEKLGKCMKMIPNVKKGKNMEEIPSPFLLYKVQIRSSFNLN